MRVFWLFVYALSMFLVSSSSFSYGGIGVLVNTIPSEDGKTYNFVIQDVASGSPANQVGLQVGDIITAVNGINTHNRFTTQQDDRYFLSLVRGQPGTEIYISVIRKQAGLLWDTKGSLTFNLVRSEMEYQEPKHLSYNEPKSCPYKDDYTIKFNSLSNTAQILLNNPTDIYAMNNFEIQQAYSRRLIVSMQTTNLCSAEINALNNLLQRTAYVSNYAAQQRNLVSEGLSISSDIMFDSIGFK